jgi:hypothetical protein
MHTSNALTSQGKLFRPALSQLGRCGQEELLFVDTVFRLLARPESRKVYPEKQPGVFSGDDNDGHINPESTLARTGRGYYEFGGYSSASKR